MIGKNLTGIFGLTGAGKSTFMNAVLIGVDNMQILDTGEILVKPEFADRVNFGIGHKATSETGTPNILLEGDNEFGRAFADLPGNRDSNTEKELWNMTAIQLSLKFSQKCSLWFFFTEENLRAMKGKAFVE